MAKAPGGPHPLAGKVFSLSGEGYSQRQVAAMAGLSQSTVNRILSGPVPEGHSDPDGVHAEFEALAKAAAADGSLEAFRHVHAVAKTCHANGYDVPFHALPYIVALSAAVMEATSARDRARLNAEILCVYADKRDWERR